MEELQKKASKCDNCLCWLKHCQAECCKQFRVATSLLNKTRKGYLVNSLIPHTEKSYWRLKGCSVIFNQLIIPFNIPHEEKGIWTYFYVTCNSLEDDLCSLHGTSDKPLVCQGFDESKGLVPGRGYITPNCLANYKQVK